MKLLFVAVFNKNSTNWSQSDALKRNGVDVIEFNYREISSKIGNSRRDEVLIEKCKKEKPDVILFSKCNEIHYRVVDECNKISKTILWYMDPLNSQFNTSLIEKINRCDLTFCALTTPYLKAKEIGGNKVFFLQEGFDHIHNYPMDVKKIYDVSFIGNLRNKRVDYHRNIPFKVISDAYVEKHSLAVSQTKINLNFTEGGTSDRTYKVLASRGFLLTEPWPEMETDFTIGEDLDIFTNVSELKEKIHYYLNNELEMGKIRDNGYNKVQKFSRIMWAKKIIEKINNKKN